MKVRFKKCTIDNIDQLVQISRSTFFEAFSSVNSEENIWKYMNSIFSHETLWKEVNNPNSGFYLALLNDEIAGYIKINFRDAQSKFEDENFFELEHIYILKSFHGNGLGQMLLNKAIDLARKRLADYLWLGVWKKNARAIHFYQKNGFVKFGERDFFTISQKRTDILMRLEL